MIVRVHSFKCELSRIVWTGLGRTASEAEQCSHFDLTSSRVLSPEHRTRITTVTVDLSATLSNLLDLVREALADLGFVTVLRFRFAFPHPLV